MKVEFAIAGPGAGPGQKNIEVKIRRVVVDIGETVTLTDYRSDPAWLDHQVLSAKIALLRSWAKRWKEGCIFARRLQ